MPLDANQTHCVRISATKKEAKFQFSKFPGPKQIISQVLVGRSNSFRHIQGLYLQPNTGDALSGEQM